MEIWVLAIFSFATFITVLLTNLVQKWRNPSCNGELPPGSMGIPLIGESLQFFRSHSSFDVHPFVQDRVKRYGTLFKTSLLGYRIIVSTDPEFNHFIFQQEGTSVEIWYMDTFMELIGKQKLTRSIGCVHKYLRNMVLDIVGPEKQKEKLLHEMEDVARKNLDIWCKQGSVEVKKATLTMTFSLGSKKLLSYDPTKHSNNLKDCYKHFLEGLISFPISIPGAIYYKCLKGQRKGIQILKDMLKERFQFDKKHGDLIDLVIEDMKKTEPTFDLDGAAYFLSMVLFATFETMSLGITLAINFIAEHPSVLEELTEEHERILQNKRNDGDSLTWNDYKSMKFTSNVIDETLRLGNIVPTIFRRVTRDIKIDRYTIPAGWIVMVCPPAIHLNPQKYEDPLLLNPWRWKGQGSSTSSKSYMAFGGGVRLCVGAEFAKLQMAIFLHYFVTKYRWTKVGEGKIIRRPGLSFPNGLHIKITKR